MKRGFRINPNDNVAIVLEAVEPGEQVQIEDICVVAHQSVPMLHKMALEDIPLGQAVKKFGSSIGEASCDIAKGDHVHLHNLVN